MDRRAFTTKFQYMILRGLEFRATTRTVKGSIEIKKSVYDHLLELGVCHSYRSQPDLASEFVLTSFLENNDYFFIMPNQLECKLGSQKTIRANGREYSSGSYTFTFRFTPNFGINRAA
jgi:hypothetical protein